MAWAESVAHISWLLYHCFDLHDGHIVADYFDMPEGYTKKNFDETMELIESRHQSDGECQRAELEEVDSGDADTPEHLEESLAELIPSAEDIDKFFADNDDAQDTEDRSG
mmetsp:Transcript_5537/g.20183  ORF Transcript_5537/g.20183 Transcript_5537/m.20183 type:complete len:110 (+) Transcript_5537:1477-1806(+)